MKGRGSRVIVHGSPQAGFLRVPNGFIRDPSVKPGPKMVIQWLASQSESWVVYKSRGADELGVTAHTFATYLKQAAQSAYLKIEETGEPDAWGNAARVYHVALTGHMEPMSIRDSGRCRESTSREELPEDQSLSRSTASTERPTFLPQNWRPNHTHAVMVNDQKLDMSEVLDSFMDTEASKEMRSDWDRVFGHFINAYADGSVWTVFA